MQLEFAFAAPSAAAVAPRDAWPDGGVEAGMSATSINPGMQIAFACTGVVVPDRRSGVTDLAGEITERKSGPGEGVMTFDAFTIVGREVCRESVTANVTRS